MATIKEYLDYAELAQASYGLGYGLGEIQTKYGKLQDLTIKTLSNGTILLLKNNPQYIVSTTTTHPLAGYGTGAFATVLGNSSNTTKEVIKLDNYELIFKLQKDGNDLILNDLSTNPTVIRIKNYTANSLNLNITQDMFNNLPSLDGNQTPNEPNSTLIGTNEIDTLIGSEVNNTFISNAGNDSITITNYFDNFSKIENIQLSTGEKLIPEFNNTNISDFFLFDEVRKVA